MADAGSSQQNPEDLVQVNQQLSESRETYFNVIDSNKKRWDNVGTVLHTVLAPVLRKYVSTSLGQLYETLKRNNKIDTQQHPHQLSSYGTKYLNYEAINYNKTIKGKGKEKRYDYCVKDPVDLSKLFLQSHMTHYSAFDEDCDLSALLGIIIGTSPQAEARARQVHVEVRNRWGHCNLSQWDDAYYKQCLSIIDCLISSLCLAKQEENHIFKQLYSMNRYEQPRSRHPMPIYKMTANPRGLCVIINNKNFQKMKPREGTDEDKKRLEAAFEKLGFQVQVICDLTSKDMKGVMKDIQQMDHSQYNALVVCILSHGGEEFIYRDDRRNGATRPLAQDVPIKGNYVYGTDDKLVPIRYLTMYFRASVCKTLANKPKLFFIQACQGKDKHTGVLLETDVDHDGPSISDSWCLLETDVNHVPSETSGTALTHVTPVARPKNNVIPDESDFLLGYATVFGYVSYRSKSRGSIYIKSLTENLEKFARTALVWAKIDPQDLSEHRKTTRLLDLQQILTMVNYDVSQPHFGLTGAGEEKKQVSMTQNQLRKLLYFFPDNLS